MQIASSARDCFMPRSGELRDATMKSLAGRVRVEVRLGSTPVFSTFSRRECFDGARDVTDRFAANWVEFQLRLVTGRIIHRIPAIISFGINITLLHIKRLIFNDSYAK